MGQISTSELLDRVKARMDEVDHAASSVVDVGVIDNRPITSLIEKLLDESRIDVLYNAPLNSVPVSEKAYSGKATAVYKKDGDGNDTDVFDHAEYDFKYDSSNSGAQFETPDDCLRIVSIKSESWEKSVTTISDIDGKKMVRQHYPALRARNSNPFVVAIDGRRLVAFPSSKKTANTIKLNGSNYDGYDDIVLHYVSSLSDYSLLSERSLNALCWDCASKVFIAMGMIESAAKCYEQYKSLIS